MAQEPLKARENLLDIFSVLVDPYKGLVVLPFDELQRICRHEKGGYCKEIRDGCTPQNCPKIIK